MFQHRYYSSFTSIRPIAELAEHSSAKYLGLCAYKSDQNQIVQMYTFTFGG